MAKSVDIEVSTRTVTKYGACLDWILGDRLGLDTYTTRTEVWKGIYTQVRKSGVFAYADWVNHRTITELVEDFFSDPEGYLTAQSTWRPDSGSARMTWVLNRILLRGFGWGPNRWRTLATNMSRTSSISDHADRGGTSTQQGADRLMHDHAQSYQSPNNAPEFAESMGKITQKLAAHKFGDRLVSIWRMRLERIPNGTIAATLNMSQSAISTHWEKDIRPIVAEEFPELVALKN